MDIWDAIQDLLLKNKNKKGWQSNIICMYQSQKKQWGLGREFSEGLGKIVMHVWGSEFRLTPNPSKMQMGVVVHL